MFVDCGGQTLRREQHRRRRLDAAAAAAAAQPRRRTRNGDRGRPRGARRLDDGGGVGGRRGVRLVGEDRDQRQRHASGDETEHVEQVPRDAAR